MLSPVDSRRLVAAWVAEFDCEGPASQRVMLSILAWPVDNSDSLRNARRANAWAHREGLFRVT